jgi:hypothetical protein
MNRKTLFTLLLVLALTFTLAACGGNKASDNGATDAGTTTTKSGEATNAKATTPEAPTSTPEPPTPTPEPPTPTPEPKEELTSEFVKVEDVANSYHAKGEYTYDITHTPADDQQPVHIDIIFESDWVKTDNSYGYNLSTTMSGLDTTGAQDGSEDIQEIQMISIDDTTYIKLGDQWISASREEAGDDGPISIGIEDFVESVDDLEKVGKEKINGVKTIHYKFKDDAAFQEVLNSAMISQLDDGEDITQFETVDIQTTGDLWIAEKEKYPVKVEINIEGTFKSKTDGSTTTIKGRILSEISNINGDIVIEPPAEAPKPGQVNIPGFEPGAFPVPEQTTVDGSFGGMINLTSQLGVDELAEFYNEQLTSMGWSLEGDKSMGTWSKGDNSFVMMITDNGDNTTSIIIMPNPE